jgi:hypothetical protein
MQVGDTITITKAEFLILAKRGLVLKTFNTYYRYIENPSRLVRGSESILGYVISTTPFGPNYTDHINGLWCHFEGNTYFTVEALPKQPLYKAR